METVNVILFADDLEPKQARGKSAKENRTIACRLMAGVLQGTMVAAIRSSRPYLEPGTR
jgi:hypothetical protein